MAQVATARAEAVECARRFPRHTPKAALTDKLTATAKQVATDLENAALALAAAEAATAASAEAAAEAAIAAAEAGKAAVTAKTAAQDAANVVSQAVEYEIRRKFGNAAIRMSIKLQRILRRTRYRIWLGNVVKMANEAVQGVLTTVIEEKAAEDALHDKMARRLQSHYRRQVRRDGRLLTPLSTPYSVPCFLVTPLP